MTELTESFWMGFYTFTGGFILAVLAIAYRSKCSNVNVCWGMLKIERDVEVELQEDLRQIQPPQPAH
jgi:hypothetical protein